MTMLACPSGPVVVTVCVTRGGAVVSTCPSELVTVTLIIELNVVLHGSNEFNLQPHD